MRRRFERRASPCDRRSVRAVGRVSHQLDGADRARLLRRLGAIEVGVVGSLITSPRSSPVISGSRPAVHAQLLLRRIDEAQVVTDHRMTPRVCSQRMMTGTDLPSSSLGLGASFGDLA